MVSSLPCRRLRHNFVYRFSRFRATPRPAMQGDFYTGVMRPRCQPPHGQQWLLRHAATAPHEMRSCDSTAPTTILMRIYQAFAKML